MYSSLLNLILVEILSGVPNSKPSKSFKSDNEYYAWWNTVKLNTIERRDITIKLLDEEHNPVAIWKVKNAWPTKVQSTDLKADGNEVAIESIELVHEGLSIQND